MSNKKLLVLLLSVAFYVMYASSYSEKIDTLKEQILYLNMKIQKEESIKANRKKILSEIDKVLKVAEKNEKLLYSPDQNNSEIQGSIQMFLKKTASDSMATFINAAWNEPLEEEKAGYVSLPITASIKGTPDAMAFFLKNLYKSEKLLNIKTLDIGKIRPIFVYYSITVAGYKPLKKEKKHGEK